jgi:hypothetical protein
MGQEGMKSWNLQSHVVALGLASFGGAGEGGFLSGEPNAPRFQTIVGNDGTAVRWYTGDNLWKFKLKLLITSGSNDLLAAMSVADVQAARMGSNGAGVFPFVLSNLPVFGGRMLIQSPRAWLVGPPNVDIQAKPTDNEWEIHAADCSEFIGGVAP